MSDGDQSGASPHEAGRPARKPMHTGLHAPTGRWWVPAHKSEKVWFAIAFAWCMVLFAMMPLWHWKGGQNPSGIRAKVDPADFRARVEQFVEDYQVGELNGMPVVEPPPGSDIYLLGRMWSWYPVLKLRKGVEYTLHLSSIDINHGFSLYPVNINFQVVPGYDYGLRIVPTEAGDFGIICNEFCGVGHHMMLGKVLVTNEDGTMPGETMAAAEVRQ
jgi:cytochrome c oxidase subunit II